MSTLEAAAIVAAVLLVGLPVTFVQIRRAQRQEFVRNEMVRLADERAERARSQDPAVLADDIDEHLALFLVVNPDIADEFARLDRAVREEQPKGDA